MTNNTAESLRKNPKQGRSKAVVDAIYGAAAQVLGKVGFDKATTNRVAAKAGVSIGSLYQYFPNKESILVPTIKKFARSTTEQFITQFRTTAEQDETSKEIIEHMVDYAVDFFLKRPDYILNIYGNIGSLNLVHILFEGREAVRTELTLMFEKIEPGLPPETVSRIAYVIINSVMGVIQSQLLGYGNDIKIDALKTDLKIMAWNYSRQYMEQ